MEFCGWIENAGHILRIDEVSPEVLAGCGGEFFISTAEFSARDRYGIMPGRGPAGVIMTAGGAVPILPEVPDLSLEEAVCEAVRLRVEGVGSERAVVTLSGGVDSALIAALAGLPCIAVGMEGSHDLAAAISAADLLGLSLQVHTIQEDELLDAVARLLPVLPVRTGMNIELGVTGYFIGRLAKSVGATRVLTGQAADELFGGYARYGRTKTLRADLTRDFEALALQRERDAAAVGLSGVWYSMPYMDERVIRASRRLADSEMVSGELRKVALRKVAERYLPADIAWKAKKAMQYGSGVTAALKRVAKKNGALDICSYADRYFP